MDPRSEESRQPPEPSAEVLYRWRVAPAAEREFFEEARRDIRRIALVPLRNGGRPRPRLLQPAIGPTPLVWEMRIELDSLRDLGELLDSLSMRDQADDLEPLGRLSRLSGVEPLGEVSPLFRVWRPPRER